jgi:F-type H+-transporting ATPase subunit b
MFIGGWVTIAVVGASPVFAAPAHEGSPDPFAWDRDLALFTGVVFIVLLLVLRKFAWGPIVEGLEKREKGIAENIAAAEQSSDEARKMIAQYDAKLASAADEVRQLLEEARRDAEHTRQEILAQAKADVSTERDRLRREIDMALDQALKDLSVRLADQAVDLAGRLVSQQLKASDHQSLIRDAVDRFAASGSRN